MATAFAGVWSPVVGRSVGPWEYVAKLSMRASASSFLASRPPVVAMVSRRAALGVMPARLAAPTSSRQLTMAAVSTTEEAQPEVPLRLKGVNKPVAVVGDLKDFAGVSISTRPELIRAITSYVKEYGLQLESDKRLFRTDAKLRKFLYVDQCSFLSISKYLTPHVKKPEDVSPELAKQADQMVLAADLAADEAEAAAGITNGGGSKSRKRKAKRNTNKAMGPARAKVEGRGIFRPLKLSKVLSKVCGADKLSRPDAVKAVWRYIKLNKLQSPSDGRVILCDPLLKDLFGCDRTDAFKMNKLLTAHLTEL
ncbi:hypothetical protein MMPV_000045 [Pyropia vietnamensis]